MKLKLIVAPLLEWFYENKRWMPWREDKDPYHVWVSEIMLQQTRIEAVIEKYTAFMQALPTVKDLSEVSEEDLLKLWEGLGYYSRARNLKAAAEVIMREYGGELPHDYAHLVKLKGIGEYTAGAIASICFNEKVPAVDGNVLRVISRITASKKNVLLPETVKSVKQKITQIMPDEAGSFNEALMELGETVCLPGDAPRCEECPLYDVCEARRKGIAAELPVRKKEVKRKQQDLSVFLITSKQGRIALEKRNTKGLLSGMYQLPNTEGHLSEKEAEEYISSLGLQVLSAAYYTDKKHVFTHIDWFMKGFQVSVSNESDRFIWVTPAELKEKYALPTAFLKFVR